MYLRPWGDTDSQILSECHQTNPSFFFLRWDCSFFFPFSFKKLIISLHLSLPSYQSLSSTVYLFLVLVCHPYQNPRIKVLCLLNGQSFLNNQFMISIFRHWKKLYIQKEGIGSCFFNHKKGHIYRLNHACVMCER